MSLSLSLSLWLTAPLRPHRVRVRWRVFVYFLVSASEETVFLLVSPFVYCNKFPLSFVAAMVSQITLSCLLHPSGCHTDSEDFILIPICRRLNGMLSCVALICAERSSVKFLFFLRRNDKNVGTCDFSFPQLKEGTLEESVLSSSSNLPFFWTRSVCGGSGMVEL